MIVVSSTNDVADSPPATQRSVQRDSVKAMLAALLSLFEEHGISYCLAQDYDRLERVGDSDVDCMVAAHDLPDRLADLIHRHGRDLDLTMVQRLRDTAQFMVLERPVSSRDYSWLQLHANRHVELAGRTLYEGDEILSARRRCTVAAECGELSFWIPAARHEFTCCLANRIVKNNHWDRDPLRLSRLYHEDPTGCHAEVTRLWGSCVAGQVHLAANQEDWTGLRAAAPRLRSHLLKRLAWRRPVALAKNLMGRLARRVRRLAVPDRGLTLVLLGPDGSGKSSVLQALRATLAPAFSGSLRRSFPPALLGRVSATSRSPHATPPRSALGSSVRALAYWLVYSLVADWTVTRPALARNMLVLHDRHFVDTLVDPRRYRYGGPAWLLRAIWRVTPKPDLVVLLDVPAEVAQSRKQEVSADETARQRHAYRQLVQGLPNGRLVDASAPLDQVVAEVEQIVRNWLSRRVESQLSREDRS